MSTIPSNLVRISTSMGSDLMLNNLRRTNVDMLKQQTQISTGLRINRPSDEAKSAGQVSQLRTVLELFDQRINDLNNAAAVVDVTDQALGEAGNLMLEAQNLALSQIGLASLPDTRASLSVVVDGLIDSMFQLSNQSYLGVQLFGGRASEPLPFIEELGGFRYVGARENLSTNLSEGGSAIDINTNGVSAFGALSSRVTGTADLNPSATPLTRIRDVQGARNLGVTLGSVRLDVNATISQVDLTPADSLDDVADLLNAAIAAAGGTGTVAVTANGFTLTSGGGETLTISDFGTGITAADLGIQITSAGGVPTAGLDINPRLTLATNVVDFGVPVDLLSGLKITNGTASQVVSFGGALTVQDMVNAVTNANLGVRLEINAAGTGFDLVNEISGIQMSIGENTGGSTATDLGLRSFAASTLLADFNSGLGVQNISGATDFRIELHDGTQIDGDIDGAVTVQDVLNAITLAAGAAPLTAQLASDGNGIELLDGSAGAGAFRVVALNNSFAALDLGILQNMGAASTLTGNDNAQVEADSPFTHLIQLRTALIQGDDRLITLAGERVQKDIQRLAAVRAEQGVRSNRIVQQQKRTEDEKLQTESLLSLIRDTDYAQAISRFEQLQVQLQANLQSGSSLLQLTLLDFLR